MSASERNVGGKIRLGNLVAVLGWHAGVGGVCLARGRSGFEALTQLGGTWAVGIMLAGSVVVMAELAFRTREQSASQRWLSGGGLVFALGTTAGWAWVFWSGRSLAYDILAAQLSRGIGADLDPETGAGFAGIPGLALPFAAGLAAYCGAIDLCLQGRAPLASGVSEPWRRVLRPLVLVLGVLTLLGVLHFSNGVLLRPNG